MLQTTALYVALLFSRGGPLSPSHASMSQFHNSSAIQLAIVGTICSIAFFNFSGISVTKEMSATTRMVLDSVRTLTIWMYGLIGMPRFPLEVLALTSVLVGWESFQYLQIIGFFFLIMGTFVYNDILVTPFLRRRGWIRGNEGEKEALLVNAE